jgi:hypothetical protein
MTSDEDFACSRRQDRLLDAALGPTLTQGTLRLGAILLVSCAIVATLSFFLT